MDDIMMTVDLRIGFAKAATIDNAGVIKRVAKDEISIARQRRDCADIRQITGT